MSQRLQLRLGSTISDVPVLLGQVPIPPPDDGAPPAFVAGGADDCIVDVDGVRELAAWSGVEPRLFPGMAHNMMLVSLRAR